MEARAAAPSLSKAKTSLNASAGKKRHKKIHHVKRELQSKYVLLVDFLTLILFCLVIFIGAFSDKSAAYDIIECFFYAFKLIPGVKYYSSRTISDARKYLLLRYLVNFLCIAPITFIFRLVNHEQNTDYLATIIILCANELLVIGMCFKVFKSEATDALDEVPHSEIVYKDAM